MEVSKTLLICSKTILPHPFRNISMNHIYLSFNQKVQVDLSYCKQRNVQHVFMHSMDTVNSFYKPKLVQNGNMSTLIIQLDIIWTHIH